MVADKPIKISESTKKDIDNLKTHPRETYDDIVTRLVKENKENKGKEKEGGD